jgi:AcrR family transcriptional regulator
VANKGRPRSEKAKKAILDAAYALLLEKGFHAITIEEIAKQAGVSKATIYKWWPNKAAVAADSFFAASTENFPLPDTGSCEEDLFNQANQLSRFLATDKGRIITELIAEGQFDADVANAYRSRYFKPRRSISRKILEQAIVRGELPDDLDLELCIDLIFAPLFYRLLITGAETDSAFLKDLISYAFNGIRRRDEAAGQPGDRGIHNGRMSRKDAE